MAAFYGNPETIEWIFSDGPIKAIEEFIKSHKSDKRSSMLAKGDWRSRIARWFGTEFTTNRDNAFHAALIGGKIEGIDTVYQMFIKQGIAPLTILESKQQKPKHNSLMIAARVTIEFDHIYEKYSKHRGDPTVIDEHGFNLLHILIYTKNAVDLRSLLNRLSDEQTAKMIMQKTFRTLHTPISLAVCSRRVDIVQNVLEHGKEQLRLRDANGNLPIHTAVGNGYAKIALLLINTDSSILLMEDGAGLLPIEIAQNQYLLCRTQVDPITNVSCASQSRIAWYNSRPENKEGKNFAETTNSDQNLDISDHVATLETLKKAMVGIDVKKRALVSLLDVSDVIRQATKHLDDKNKRVSQQESSGAHLCGHNSLWQMSKEEEG